MKINSQQNRKKMNTNLNLDEKYLWESIQTRMTIAVRIAKKPAVMLGENLS